MWGSNLPVTRTPDAHWMTEARYRGQKVVAVAPDYADNVKFADEWLPAAPGHRRRAGDGDGPRRAQGVLRRPAGRRTSPTTSRSYTDLPFLVRLEPRPRDGTAYVRRRQVPHRRGPRRRRGGERERRLQDRPGRRRTGEPVVPERLARRTASATSGVGRWNLDLGDVDPLLSLPDHSATRRRWCDLPRFDAPGRQPPTVLRRGVPGPAGRRTPGHHRLRPAARAVRRRAATGLPGDVADRLRRRRRAVHPGLAGARSPACPPRPRPGSAASSPQNAEESHGRSMIIMGAGTNHWFHSDTIYRAFLTLTTLTGCQGVNGGGWAHYVGQEKVRPDHRLHPARQRAWTGSGRRANDPDGVLVPPHRPVPLRPRSAPTPWPRPPARASSPARRTADVHRPVAPGWAGCRPTRPSTATRSTSPTRRQAAGKPGRRVRRRAAEVGRACASPARTRTPRRTSRGSCRSGGPTCSAPRPRATSTSSSTCSAPTPRCGDRDPRGGRARATWSWHDEAPEGKLDLLLTLDFRMTSTTIFSDVVLPAATWYEKHDLNTTDMHPFVHSFNPAIARRGRPAPTGTPSRRSRRRSASSRPRTSACARTSSRCR